MGANINRGQDRYMVANNQTLSLVLTWSSQSNDFIYYAAAGQRKQSANRRAVLHPARKERRNMLLLTVRSMLRSADTFYLNFRQALCRTPLTGHSNRTDGHRAFFVARLRSWLFNTRHCIKCEQTVLRQLAHPPVFPPSPIFFFQLARAVRS